MAVEPQIVKRHVHDIIRIAERLLDMLQEQGCLADTASPIDAQPDIPINIGIEITSETQIRRRQFPVISIYKRLNIRIYTFGKASEEGGMVLVQFPEDFFHDDLAVQFGTPGVDIEPAAVF